MFVSAAGSMLRMLVFPDPGLEAAREILVGRLRVRAYFAELLRR